MTGLSIQLSDEQMQKMLSEAMLRALDSGTREALIARALEYLVKPGKDFQGKPAPSPLEQAFQNAMSTVAREEAHKMLVEDGRFQERVRGLIAAATEKVFTEKRDALVDKIASAIAGGLTDRSY